MREEEIREILADEIKIRKEIAGRIISERYLADKEKYIQEFVNLIDGIFKQCNILQKSHTRGKGRIKYLYISYMRSSIEDETYEYLIRMYDETYYYDHIEAEARFALKYRIQLLNEDIDYFRHLIMSRVIRPKKYEVKDFLREYIEEVYIKPIPDQIEDSIEKIMGLESYKSIYKSKDIAMYYGEMTDSYFRKIPLYIEE